jgi:hypothetical protein
MDTAKSLDRRHSLMTDTIHREKRAVCATQQSRNSRSAVFDAAIVMKEVRAGALYKLPQLRHLVARPPIYNNLFPGS